MRISMELFKRGIACLLFIGVFTFGQLNAQCVKPSFVQTVTVTNPNVATLTDYVVKLTINTSALQAGGKLSNKFGFVFYDSDCNTQLNYWPSDVDPFPSVTASYYVRIPSIPGSSSKLITMHYDNATTCSQLIGNTFSVIGSVAAAPTVGFSAATTWEMSNYTFPTNATTFRWDVRSANTGTFKPKTSYTIATAQYVQAEGSNKTVAIGTNFYVDELPVDAGGHPSFFTPTLLTIGQNCGLCQSVKSGSGDIPPNTAPLTANSSNTAQVRIYYRKRAAAEPTTSNGAEFDVTKPVTITPAGPVVACEQDILQFTASTPFIKYNWYLDNVLLSSGAATTQAINTSGFPSGIRVLKVVA